MRYHIGIFLFSTTLTTSVFSQNFTSQVNIEYGTPTIHFKNNSSGEDDYWIRADDDRLYFLWDQGDNGDWNSPHPLYIEGRDAYFSNNAFTVKGGSRRIGIGTSSPTHPIHVKTNWSIISLDTNAQGQDAGIRFQENGLTKWHVFNDGTSDTLIIDRDSASNPNGLLLIDSDLDVVGTTETDSLVVGVGGDGGRMSYGYESNSATLIMYDRDDSPAIRFRTSPTTNSETNPEHEVSIVSVPHGNRIKVNAGQFDVQGTIRAEEIIVETGWSDYVFEEDYRLAPLSEVEAHIEEKGHLPGIPSAAEIQENGAKLSELVTLQMAKIEELTLHLIEKEKQLESANLRIEQQSIQLSSILERLNALER